MYCLDGVWFFVRYDFGQNIFYLFVEFIVIWIVNMFVVLVKDLWFYYIFSYYMGVFYLQFIFFVKGMVIIIQLFLFVEKYVEILVVMFKVIVLEERGLGSL